MPKHWDAFDETPVGAIVRTDMWEQATVRLVTPIKHGTVTASLMLLTLSRSCHRR